MTRGDLMGLLPQNRNMAVMLKKKQEVRDIIREVIAAHKENGELYDLIAGEFDQGSTRAVCGEIYYFLKNNIRYHEETDDDQTISVPQGILGRGVCDCKGYAGFAAGILDGLNRRGRNIDWNYRFASYDITSRTPHHVFVVVRDRGEEVWIDPTPGAEGKVPVWQQDQKCKSMALRKYIAGIGDESAEIIQSVHTLTEADLREALADVDTSLDVTDEQYNAIALLLNTGIINEQGEINQARMNEYAATLQGEELDTLMQAYNTFHEMGQAVGSFFSNLWRGVKVVSLAVPRASWLSLVALNVFGYATKVDKVLSYPDSAKKLIDLWFKLGGKESGLRSAVNSGKKKKAILGSPNVASIGVLPAVAAWLAAASAIIAAVMPVVAQMLKNKKVPEDTYAAYDAAEAGAGLSATGNPVMDFVKNNPIVAIGGAGLLLYYLFGKDE